MNRDRMDAIILSNALIYASPSNDQKSVNSKQKMWDRLISSLDWDVLEDSTKKKSEKSMTRAFGLMGVPVNKKRG